MTGNDMTNNPQAASDEKTLKAALEAGSIEAYTSGGIRRDFSFHEAQLRRFAAILTDPLKAELERQTALVQQQAEVIAGLAKACLRLGEAVRRLKERAPHKACIADRTAQIAGEEALAAAAPFLPVNEKEK